jgi:hypothetical protein
MIIKFIYLNERYKNNNALSSAGMMMEGKMRI